MELKERLRSQRRMRGLTQKELGNLIKISEITLRRWESTKSSQVPDATNLRALADVLNTTVSYLTGETDDPSPAGGRGPVDASIHHNTNTGNNTVTVESSEKIPEVRKLGEKEVKGVKLGFYNVDGMEETVFGAPTRFPWWVSLSRWVYITAGEGDQQDIDAALDQMRAGIKVLEHAKTLSKPPALTERDQKLANLIEQVELPTA